MSLKMNQNKGNFLSDKQLKLLLDKVRVLNSDVFESQVPNEYSIENLINEFDFCYDKIKSNEKKIDEIIKHFEYCFINRVFKPFERSEETDKLDVLKMCFNIFSEEIQSEIISKNYFNRIMNGIPLIMLVFNNEGNISFANSESIRFLKLKKNFESQNYTTVLPKEILLKCADFFNLNETNSSDYFEFDVKINKKLYLAGIIQKIYIQNALNFIFIARDVTELKNTELKIKNANIEGQDQERDRISKDLHDSLGQELTAAKMYIHSANKIFKSVRDEHVFDNALNIIVNTIKSIGDICYQLSPAYLPESNLIVLVEELINRLKNFGTEFIFSPCQLFEFKIKSEELSVYRIIQEFINNSLKHANAKFIFIIFKMSAKNKTLNVKIVDDGKGFDMENTKFNNGIYNIKQRLKVLNTEYQYTSVLGKGTELKFEISNQHFVSTKKGSKKQL